MVSKARWLLNFLNVSSCSVASSSTNPLTATATRIFAYTKDKSLKKRIIAVENLVIRAISQLKTIADNDFPVEISEGTVYPSEYASATMTEVSDSLTALEAELQRLLTSLPPGAPHDKVAVQANPALCNRAPFKTNKRLEKQAETLAKSRKPHDEKKPLNQKTLIEDPNSEDTQIEEGAKVSKENKKNKHKQKSQEVAELPENKLQAKLPGKKSQINHLEQPLKELVQPRPGLLLPPAIIDSFLNRMVAAQKVDAPVSE